ncbi:MAG TPA: hypothetical protein VK623_01855 [Flavobacterium sp.]|nr:hypothetical protein [Flavobacterium sp.]
MTSKKFILNKIKELVSQFTELTIKYEYEESCDSHFIEVSPIKEFESNKNYISKERAISLEFVNLFPFEILTFISEADGIALQSPLIFKPKPQIKYYLNGNKFNFEHIISGLFEDYDVDWKTSINFKTPNRGLNLTYANIFDNITAKKTNVDNLEKIQNPEIYTTQDPILQSEEIDFDCDQTTDDYLLAA